MVVPAVAVEERAVGQQISAQADWAVAGVPAADRQFGFFGRNRRIGGYIGCTMRFTCLKEMGLFLWGEMWKRHLPDGQPSWLFPVF